MTGSEFLESEEQFQSVVKNIPGVVYRCECLEPWVQHFMSDYMEILTGYKASEFLEGGTRSFESIIHPDDSERVARATDEAVRSGVFYQLEYRLIHADG